MINVLTANQMRQVLKHLPDPERYRDDHFVVVVPRKITAFNLNMPNHYSTVDIDELTFRFRKTSNSMDLEFVSINARAV